MSQFSPELVLEETQRRDLAISVIQPGFKVQQTIWKSCVDTFAIDLLNAVDDKEIISKHQYAKVAAQLYTMFVERVNGEVQAYTMAPRPTDKPIDVTDVLDMGDYTHEDDGEEPFF